jgi:hypothetical protein
MLLKLIFLIFFSTLAYAQNTKPLIVTDNATQTCNTTRMVYSPGSVTCLGSVATVSSGSGGGSGNIDGGNSLSIYLPNQIINGGSASIP